MFRALRLQWDFYPPGDSEALENVWLIVLEGAVHPTGITFLTLGLKPTFPSQHQHPLQGRALRKVLDEWKGLLKAYSETPGLRNGEDQNEAVHRMPGGPAEDSLWLWVLQKPVRSVSLD